MEKKKKKILLRHNNKLPKQDGIYLRDLKDFKDNMVEPTTITLSHYLLLTIAFVSEDWE